MPPNKAVCIYFTLVKGHGLISSLGVATDLKERL